MYARTFAQEYAEKFQLPKPLQVFLSLFLTAAQNDMRHQREPRGRVDTLVPLTCTRNAE